MKVTPHGDYLHKLTRLWSINCYFVREEDGLTLIDTLLSNSEKAILKAAREIGMPIVRIVLTHAHNDHVGSVDALHAALPEAEVIYPARDARFLAGDMTLEAGEAQAKLRGGYVRTETRPTRTVTAGDRIGSLETIASPGHTPGHVSYLDTRDRTLIAGDAWVTLGGVVVAGQWSLFPLPKSATWHIPTAIESARALRALEPARLAVGHGPVIESPLAAMDRALSRA